MKNTKNVVKIIVSVTGIITAVLIAPLLSSIDKNDSRILRIEQYELPQLKEEQAELKVHIVRLSTRLEAQTEMIRKIADDVEYIRRRMEKVE